MNVVKNLPALTKILASLPGLHTYKKQMDAARKAGLEKARLYFSGENLAYWSPLARYTKYLDPESAFRRNTSESAAQDHMSYPWQKTLMFGIDITF